MAEPPAPPPLPARLTSPIDVIGIGSALWLLATLALLGAWIVGGRELDLAFLTCVVGTALGGVGYAVFTWQRSAVRRGSRTAQVGLDD